MSATESLVRMFLEAGAFQWSQDKPFVLSSGVKSEYYVDCRRFLSDPSQCIAIAREAYPLLAPLGITAVGGLVLGAVPLSMSLVIMAYQISQAREQWRTFMIRKESKTYGLSNLIEGDLRTRDQVLVVDDVLTSGNSIVLAIEALKRSGLDVKVKHVLVLVDRQEQNGRQRLEQEYGVQVHSLLTLEELKAEQLRIKG